MPVPWGHLAAKWWGRRDVRPVLAVHGFLDNAGTFDRLIPLLPRHVGYLAIDLPGHGRSSHFPVGMVYTTFDFLYTIEMVRLHFDWERFSFLGHSLGSLLSFLYSALHPDRVDLLMGIDLLMPLQLKQQFEIERLREQLAYLVRVQQRQSGGNEPPAYSYDELVERLIKGSRNSVSADVAPHLLDRAIQPSSQDPGKFCFSRDGRLKTTHFMISYQTLALEMARMICAPHLFIKASKSPYYEEEKHFSDAVNVLTESNPLFRLARMEGTHHLHLMDPLPVSVEISAYVNKYRSDRL